MTNEITGYYDQTLVVLSLIIAIVSAYSAITISEKLKPEAKDYPFWLFSAGGALGLGIWSMHFIGMLAFKIHISLNYDLYITLLSLAVAVVTSSITIHIIANPRTTTPGILVAALILGSGIGAMHYIGMYAIHTEAQLVMHPGRILISVVYAIIGSIASLFLLRYNLKLPGDHGLFAKTATSIFIGTTIVGMHYIGMYAMDIIAPIENTDHFDASFDNDFFAIFIFFTSLLVMLSNVYIVKLKDTESESSRKNMLVVTMSIVALTVGTISIGFVYYAAYDKEKQFLFRIASTQATMIERFAKTDDAVLYAIVDAITSAHNEQLDTQVEHGHVNEDIEILLFHKDGNDVKFLVNDEHHHESVPIEKLATDSPLSLALNKQSGTIISKHFETGETSLSAFAFIEYLNIGVSAIVPLSDIRAPFILAISLSGFLGVFVIAIGSRLLIATIDPIINQLREENKERQSAEKALLMLTNHLEESVKERTEQLQTAVVDAWRANKAKSEFLANMSHEIRTPMNGVLGMIHLLQKTELTDQQQEYASTVANSAESLLVVINDVLDFSKIESGKLELEEVEFNLRDTIEDVASLLAEAAHIKGLELAVNIASNIPKWIKGDSGRIRQVLTNLTGNAIKFTDKGEVVISVTLEKILDTGSIIRFEISDTGIGISKSAQSKIFNSFEQADSSTTRQYGGTGLGLSISRKLVSLMGGDMNVRSDVGVGSTFHFTVKAGKSEKITDDIKQNQKFGHLRALIIDDNETNRVIYKHQLTEWGIEFDTADDGESGLKKVFSAVDEGNAFDLILLDMMMPNMDGLGVYQKMKERLGENIPYVFMLTSVTQGDIAKHGKELGIDIVLTKPVKQTLLYNSIAGHFSNGPKNKSATTKKTKNEDVDFSDKGLKVLLVEDHVINQKVILGVLKGLGITADLAQNGQEAVAAIEAITYDIVFMDVQMPVLDGFSATRQIRKIEGNKKHTHIIAMTANAMSGDKEKCLAAGMDDYLSKPINPEEIVDRIDQWCGQEHDSPQNKSA